MSTQPLNNSSKFRAALGAFATGVTIVTTRDKSEQDIGLTANSFNSVSLNPPMVLWSLSRQSLSLPAFLAAEYFAVHVLAATQQELSDRFATRGADKFADLNMERGPDGIPLLRDCAARFQCRTSYRYEGGDHVIFVGEVISFEQSERPALVFHAGGYAIAARPPKAAKDWDDAASFADSTFSRDFLISLLGRARFQLLQRVRHELDQLGLTETDWFILSLLATEESRTLPELDQRLAATGMPVSYEQVARLAALGFAEMHGAYNPSTVRVALTDRGRQAVIELGAAAKAAEADGERHLGYDETRLIKQWLRNIIQDSDPGKPPD